MGELPATLSGFIDEVDVSEKTLLLLNRTKPEPFVDLLSKAFEGQSVAVTEKQIPEGKNDLVCLVDDGDVVATTPLSELTEAFLLVNVDRYRTGTRQSERGSFPDVLTGLDDTEFVVEGFPRSDREKLLLVVISRLSSIGDSRTAAGSFTVPFSGFRGSMTSTGPERCTSASGTAMSRRTSMGSRTIRTPWPTST